MKNEINNIYPSQISIIDNEKAELLANQAISSSKSIKIEILPNKDTLRIIDQISI